MPISIICPSPKEFPNDRMQETLVLLDTLVWHSTNINECLKVCEVEVLCRLMECLTTTIDIQMKGIDLENDQDNNVSKPYELNDIGEMLPEFGKMFSNVDCLVEKKLSTVPRLEQCEATEWNQELEVSNIDL